MVCFWSKRSFIVSRIGLGKALPAWSLTLPKPHAREGRSGAESAESMVSRGSDARWFNDDCAPSPRMHSGLPGQQGKQKHSSQASHHWLAAYNLPLFVGYSDSRWWRNRTFVPLAWQSLPTPLTISKLTMILISSGEDRYSFPHFPISARGLAFPLSRAAWSPFLASSAAIPCTSRGQTRSGPPSAQAPHPT
jgi:hypothetical protein